MTLIARNFMIGNPKIKTLGFVEESKVRNAILGGFQEQRQWTNYYPIREVQTALAFLVIKIRTS